MSDVPEPLVPADGYYWIILNGKEVVAEMEGGMWFLPGYEGGDPAQFIQPISPRLERVVRLEADTEYVVEFDFEARVTRIRPARPEDRKRIDLRSMTYWQGRK